MDQEFRNVLVKLKNDAVRRKDPMASMALGLALRRDELLRQLIDALREIRSLPCLDGSTRFACLRPDCARCVAEQKLREFTHHAGDIDVE